MRLQTYRAKCAQPGTRFRLPFVGSLEELREQVRKVEEAAVVKKTADRKRRIWEELQEFAVEWMLDYQEQETVLLYVQSTAGRRTSDSFGGTRTLVGHIRAQRVRLNLPVAQLDVYKSGLNRLMADKPIRQATPVTYGRWKELMEKLPRKQAFIVFLAFKTASRLGEVLGLTKAHLHQRPGCMDKFAIEWKTLTKSGKKSPFEFRNYTMVQLNQDQMQWAMYVWALKDGEAITPFPGVEKDAQRDRMVRILKKIDPSLSAHSFKRGALTRLIPMIKEEGLSPILLPRLLKHKGESEPIPATTIRYGANPFDIADLGETGTLTQRL
eukprot:gene21651-1231_t